MSLEETLRQAVREEVERAIAPLREALARASLSAPAVSDEDELALVDAERIGGYSVITMRKAIAAGELAAAKGRKEWRVRRADLKAWMHKRPNADALRPLDISQKAEKMLASVGGRRK